MLLTQLCVARGKGGGKKADVRLGAGKKQGHGAGLEVGVETMEQGGIAGPSGAQ